MFERFPELAVLANWASRADGQATLYEGPSGQCVRGGPPGIGDNPDLDVIDWRPPEWLTDLYGVHGGLGRWDARAGWMRHTILPWEDVQPLTRLVRFGEENIGIDTADVVLFAPDGLGGGWVLDGRERPVIRWFDGQRHVLGPAVSRGRALAWVASGWIERTS